MTTTITTEKVIFDTRDLHDHVRQWARKSVTEDHPELLEEGNENLLESEVDSLVNLEYQYQLDDKLNNVSWSIVGLEERYNKRYKTNVDMLLFTGERFSHYGAIGGNGAGVGMEAQTLEQFLWRVDAEDYTISITEDKTLQIDLYDHDGANTVEMAFITTREVEKAQKEYEEIRDMYRYKKHVKLDKAFMKEYGY